MSSSSEPESPKIRRRRRKSSSSSSSSSRSRSSSSSSDARPKKTKKQIPSEEGMPELPQETREASGSTLADALPEQGSTAWKTRRLIEEEDTGIEVSVSDPQQRSGGIGKKFVVYHITGKDDKGTIDNRRRYKEFHELRIKLTENWPGIFIPPLPEKKAVGNMGKDFIEERTQMLDKFMSRCSKLPHIFYSNEMQVFLRTSNQVTKVLADIKRERPSNMLKKYGEHFEKFMEETGDKTESSVNKYFSNLDKTIGFFRDYRTVAKKLRAQKKSYKAVYLKFLSYTIIDYKNKLKREEKEVLDRNHKAYCEEEKQDDLEEFLQNLKELLAELSAFESIKKDINYIRKQTDKMRAQQTKYNNELSKIRSMEGTKVKTGMFKSVPKAEKIKELEKAIEETTDDLNALTKLRSIIYNLLNFQEFPRLIDVKRRTFAVGLVNYANMRDGVLNLEQGLLKSIQEHYQAYLDI